MISLQVLEDRVNLLRKINISTLDIETRVEYHMAMIDAQKARMKNLLFYFKYKTALIVEAEIKEEEKALALCYDLMSDAEIRSAQEYAAKGKNRFTQMAERGKLIAAPSVREIEASIKTILFGVPYELAFNGNGFRLTKTFPGLNIEAELDRLEAYCGTCGWKLLVNTTRTPRIQGQSEAPFYIEIGYL